MQLWRVNTGLVAFIHYLLIVGLGPFCLIFSFFEWFSLSFFFFLIVLFLNIWFCYLFFLVRNYLITK